VIDLAHIPAIIWAKQGDMCIDFHAN